MNIFAQGDKLFCADGKTDMTKRIVAFRNVANMPENNRNAYRIL